MPAAVRDTTLVTSSGRLNLAQLAGKVVVISDMMSLRQETCPLDTANVVAAARDAQRAGLGQKIVFLSVTIDPAATTHVGDDEQAEDEDADPSLIVEF